MAALPSLPIPGGKGKPPETVKDKQKAIEKEYERKMKLERRVGFLSTNMRMIIILVAVAVVLAIGGTVAYVVLTRPDPVDPVVIEQPPEDFAVTVVSLELLQNAVPSDDTVAANYDVLARVQNPYPQWGVPELDYVVTLLDSDGASVGEQRGTTYILSETEQGIMAVQVPASAIASQATFDVTPAKIEKMDRAIDIRTRTNGVVHLVSEDVNGKDRSIVSGTLINDSAFALSRVMLLASVYDSNGETIGLNSSLLQDVSSGEEREFELRWQEKLKDVSRVEVEVQVNPFEEAELLGNF